jgi:hypothetical protein
MRTQAGAPPRRNPAAPLIPPDWRADRTRHDEPLRQAVGA